MPCVALEKQMMPCSTFADEYPLTPERMLLFWLWFVFVHFSVKYPQRDICNISFLYLCSKPITRHADPYRYLLLNPERNTLFEFSEK